MLFGILRPSIGKFEVTVASNPSYKHIGNFQLRIGITELRGFEIMIERTAMIDMKRRRALALIFRQHVMEICFVLRLRDTTDQDWDERGIVPLLFLG